MERKPEVKVIIKGQVVFNENIKELVKMADDIKKEYGCDCTLILSKL